MPEDLPAQEQRRRSTPDSLTRLLRGIGLAAAVGVIYFLAAQLSLGLLMKPDGVAVFWPAAGISSGVLIALGPRARWPVAIGAMLATVAANLMGDRNVWASLAFALCNAAEALITAGLIQYYFGADFSLARLRDVLGLLIAAVVGGLLLGYGARLAYGSNIGAYFSGIVSGSLHGWLWLVAAFFGNVVGTKLRPMFGLAVERVKQTGC